MSVDILTVTSTSILPNIIDDVEDDYIPNNNNLETQKNIDTNDIVDEEDDYYKSYMNNNDEDDNSEDEVDKESNNGDNSNESEKDIDLNNPPAELDDEEMYIEVMNENENDMSMDEISKLVKLKRKQSKKDRLKMFSQSQKAIRNALSYSVQALGGRMTIENKCHADEFNALQTIFKKCQADRELKLGRAAPVVVDQENLHPNILLTPVDDAKKFEVITTPLDESAEFDIEFEDDIDLEETITPETNTPQVITPLPPVTTTPLPTATVVAIPAKKRLPILVQNFLNSSGPSNRDKLRNSLFLAAKKSAFELNNIPVKDNIEESNEGITNSPTSEPINLKDLESMNKEDDEELHQRLLRMAGDAPEELLETQVDDFVVDDTQKDITPSGEVEDTNTVAENEKRRLRKIATAFVEDEAADSNAESSESETNANESEDEREDNAELKDEQAMEVENDDEDDVVDDDVSEDDSDLEYEDVEEEEVRIPKVGDPDYNPIRAFLQQGPQYNNKKREVQREAEEDLQPKDAKDEMKAALTNMQQNSMFFSNNDTELNVANLKTAAKRFIDMEAGEEDELGNMVRSIDDEGNGEDLDSYDPNLIATENLEEDVKGQSRQARLHAKMMDQMDDEETELLKSRFVDNDALGMYKARLNQGQWGGHSSAVRSQSLLLSTDITGESVPTLNGRGRNSSLRGYSANGDDFDSYDLNMEDMSNLSKWERHVKINSLPLLKNKLSFLGNSEITQDATEINNEEEDEEERIRLQKQARLRLKYPQLCNQFSEESRNKYSDIDLGYEDESSVGIACLDDDNKIVYPKMPALMRSISDNSKSIPYLKRKRSLHTPVLANSLLDKMNLSRLGGNSNSINVDVSNSPQVSIIGANGPSTGVKDFSLFNKTISSGSAENTPKFLPRPSFLMRSITASDKSLDSFALTGAAPKPNASKDVSCKMNSANAVSKKFIFMNVDRTNSLSSNNINKTATTKDSKPKDFKNKENKSEKANNKK